MKIRKINEKNFFFYLFGGCVLYFSIMISLIYFYSANSENVTDKCIHRVYCDLPGHCSISTSCGAKWAENSINSVCPFCGKKFKIVSGSEVQE